MREGRGRSGGEFGCVARGGRDGLIEEAVDVSGGREDGDLEVGGGERGGV